MSVERIFVDTNIILDWLGHRDPFFVFARSLFHKGENGEIQILISTMSYISVEYILRKRLGTQRTLQALTGLRSISQVCSSGAKEIDLSLASRFKDFEDAFQYYSALNNGADVIISRDAKDYRYSDLSVMNAEQYLKTLAE